MYKDFLLRVREHMYRDEEKKKNPKCSIRAKLI